MVGTGWFIGANDTANGPNSTGRGGAEVEQLVQSELARERIVGGLDPIFGSGRAEQRDPRATSMRSVAEGHDVGRQVDAVIGVQVRHDDRVDLVRLHVLLQRAQRTVAKVEDDPELLQPRRDSPTPASPGRASCRSSRAR